MSSAKTVTQLKRLRPRVRRIKAFEALEALVLVALVVLSFGFASAVSSSASIRRRAEGQTRYTDLLVLKSLYDWTDGRNSWTRKDKWLQGDPCTWEGVLCSMTSSDGETLDNPAVQSLDLSGNNLRGSAPLSLLLRLPHLQALRLDGNEIDYSKASEQELELLGSTGNGDGGDSAGGPIESQIRILDLSHTTAGPDLTTLFQTGSGSTIKMPRLTTLYLSNCGLRGPFPYQIISFVPSLERLVMEYNKLSGPIPAELGNLINLRYLSLAENEFNGNIPESLGQLKRLRFLILKSNKLIGEIPPEISSGSEMPLLEHLDLSRQREEVPTGLLGNMESSDAGGLTGPLPSFASQSKLRQIDLSFNFLKSTIPSDFLASANPQTFDYAFLGSNSLYGNVPSSALIHLPADTVFLEDNKIQSFDSALCNPSRGGAIAEWGCNAILCRPGTYGPEIGRQEDESVPCRECVGSQYWGATHCAIGFPVDGGGTASPTPMPTAEPTSPVRLTERQILLKFYEKTGGGNWDHADGWSDAFIADKNQPSDAVPTGGFCDWYGVVCAAAGDDEGNDTVEELLLGSNNLVGANPVELFQLKNLRTLMLSQNPILFNADGIGEAKSLSILDLSKTGLFTLKGIETIADSLVELHVGSNSFTGELLPLQLWELTKLEQLTLDNGGFVGRIPTEGVVKLTNLKLWTATDNALTGPLPASLSSLTNLATLRLMSNRLSGVLPDALNDMTTLTVLDLSRQRGITTAEGATYSSPGITGPLLDFSKFANIRRLDLSTNGLTGPVPQNFLQSANAGGQFEYADLSSNYLDGVVPPILATMHDVYLKDNELTGIHPKVCDSVKGSLLEEFECDAILCHPGTYNALGRQQSFDNPCEQCNLQGGSEFYGSIACEVRSDGAGGIGNSTAAPTPTPGGWEGEKPPTEREVLEMIYDNCGGTYWTNKRGWKDPDAQVCDWFGVTCDLDGKVTEVTFRSNNLIGSFPSPAVFRHLLKLESLVLDGNDIDFSFQGIEDANVLETLDLTHTDLDSLEGLDEATPSLKNVYLTENKLHGPFPPELMQLTNLTRLSLATNSLRGPIPSDIGTLTNLAFLSLHDNEFEGSIPKSISGLSNLLFFLLQSNRLNGTIPEELASLTSLWFVDLSDQSGSGLTGSIPSFDELTAIKRLDLSSNSLGGELPLDLLQNANPDEFEHLDLSHNQFTGEAPAVLAKFPVDSYDLTDNLIQSINDALCSPSLGGYVATYGCNAVLCKPRTYNDKGREIKDGNPCVDCPENLYYGTSSCTSLGTLAPTKAPVQAPGDGSTLSPVGFLTEREALENLYDSTGGPRWEKSEKWLDKTESICDWFGVRCTPGGEEAVESIMLGSNNLVGTPNTMELFTFLPKLETLVLESNKILFGFGGIENAGRLKSLDLGNTGLHSLDGIEMAGGLSELNIDSNDLKGPIPKGLFQVKSLEQLTMDNNALTGPIPSEVENLRNLKLLSVKANDLTGQLPTQIGSLTELLTLRLKANSLIGSFPSEMNNMESLSFVDLSGQTSKGGPGFTGDLPDFANLSGLRRLELQSNSIGGSIPSTFLGSVIPQFFEFADLSSNHLIGVVPSNLASLDNIYLQGNRITGIDPILCDKSRGGIYEQFGCNAVLCPIGSFNSIGRQESDATGCDDCPTAKHFGAIECKDPDAGHVVLPGISQQNILAKLYEATEGDFWNDNTNWGNEDESVCNWAGVECASGPDEKIESINLSANNLAGTPPPEIFQLPHLTSLSLYSNPLDGFSFGGIENAKNLTELLLDATGLKSIEGVGNAPALETLNLRLNSLEGGIPFELSKLTTLKSLTLSFNNFDDAIPPFFDRMTNLHTLLLSSNSLSGKLDGVIFPPSLRILDLSKNKLSGFLPSEFLNGIPDVAHLEVDLSGNDIEGALPVSLKRFDSMDLYLADNLISEIDDQFCGKSRWNDGDVGRYGCAGLLCPVGHYATSGRQTSASETCKRCEGGAPFLGSTSCNSVAGNSDNGENDAAAIWPLAVTLSGVFLVFLVIVYFLFCSSTLKYRHANTRRKLSFLRPAGTIE